MKRKINAIVIHCAATPNGKDIKAAAIDAMHKARGFKRDSQALRSLNPELKHIGYHFVIEVDGNLATGRGIEEIGAHVQGSNAKSIGICMIGTDRFSIAQWEALKQQLFTLCENISGQAFGGNQAKMLAWFEQAGIKIKGHRDYSPDLNGDGIIQRNEWIKTCPGFDVADWLAGAMLPPADAIYDIDEAAA
jgi:N-acetylmuramoyl-L-alanine amidase